MEGGGVRLQQCCPATCDFASCLDGLGGMFITSQQSISAFDTLEYFWGSPVSVWFPNRCMLQERRFVEGKPLYAAREVVS